MDEIRIIITANVLSRPARRALCKRAQQALIKLNAIEVLADFRADH
jgi:hypothetical protein